MRSEYHARKSLAEARRRLMAIRPRPAAMSPVRSIMAPDNAQSLFGLGQIAEIYDVLDGDGVEAFILGVNALDDSSYVE